MRRWSRRGSSSAIIGLSTHSEAEIAAAADLPLDYIAVGPIWETPTKPGRPAVGVELISNAAEHAVQPFFGIGGISPLNAEQVVRAGARRLCVVRAIRDAPDPGVAAQALRRAFAATEGAAASGQDTLLDQPAPWRGVAPGG
jgi:thiamine-phosphate pyrophosphorylase